MSADIKWEAVDVIGKLPVGGDIRVRAKGGTTWIPAKVESLWNEAAMVYLDGATRAFALNLDEWAFERAVPERTLPTELGRYMRASDLADIDRVTHLQTKEYLYDGTDWYDTSAAPGHKWISANENVPADLVRLVPVTEADELRKRIEKVHDTLDDSMIWDSDASLPTLRTKIRAALDGEA